MKESFCDICERKCGDMVRIYEYVPFIIRDNKAEVGYHTGTRGDKADFTIILMQEESSTEKDICERCGAKIVSLTIEHITTGVP